LQRVLFGFTLVKSVIPNCTDGTSSVYAQELFPVIISHQTPMYFTGLIQEVSSILHGSFRFNVILEAKISRASALAIIVLQGETHGACKCPLFPLASGVKCD
jgi:hypothetical protein